MRIISQLIAAAGLAIIGVGAGDMNSTAAPSKDILRVCASTKEAPYSMKGGEGFETRIARIIAEETGRDLELVWIDRAAIYLVRDGIDEGICEVVMGVDAGDERLLTTDPYYRTGYVFVSRQDHGFKGTRWQDTDTSGINRIAYRFYSPTETLLKYAGKYATTLAYSRSLINFKSRRNQYINVSGERVVQEVIDGNADIAIAFAPTVARYVRDSDVPLRMQIITNDIERNDGVVIPLTYAQSIGVANRAPELRDEIDAALKARSEDIRAVLKKEGIPLLPADA